MAINPTTSSVVMGRRIVRKTLHLPADPGPEWSPCAHEQDWNWWRRELLVLRSGLLRRGPLQMPLLLSVRELPGRVVMDLVRITGETPDLIQVSRDLGAAQATLTTHPAWLALDWAAGYAQARGARVPDTRHDLPTTICHGDIWPPNLIRSGKVTYLLDWGWAHLGPLGEDLATLWVESVLFGFSPDLKATDLVEAYANGARCDPELIQRGLRYGLDIKYSWLHESLRTSDNPRWDERGRRTLLELTT